MNKLYAKKNLVLISTVLIGVLWCVLVLLFADFDEAEFYFWGGFTAGILTTAISAVALLLIQMKREASTTELSYFSMIIVSVYFLIGLFINTIYCILENGDHEKVLVALNLVLLVFFIIAMLFSFRITGRAGALAKTISTRTAPTRNYSGMIAGMLALTTDPAVKAKLLELKKVVDYGTNVSREYAEAVEGQFYQKLIDINNMIGAGVAAGTVNNEIDTAIRLYRARNASMQTL